MFMSVDFCSIYECECQVSSVIGFKKALANTATLVRNCGFRKSVQVKKVYVYIFSFVF
jgi:hypothetical protein